MDARVALALVLVALTAPLAGCQSLGGTPTAADGPALPAGATGRAATVTEVIDGDTVTVRFEDGTTDTVRLLGIDAPETRGSNTPGEFEGVPETAAGRACLDRAAGDATRALVRRALGSRVRVATDPAADERDRYGRLLAYLVRDGQNLDYWLVREGHARVYDSPFGLADRFYAAERTAQAERRGLWDCRTPATPTAGGPLRVRVHADAPGDDRENPNGEYVVLANASPDPLVIGGWSVTDAAGHEYVFPVNATIPPGGNVTLYSGSGTDTATAFYWGVGPVWNNGGDTATVRDENGTVRASTDY